MKRSLLILLFVLGAIVPELRAQDSLSHWSVVGKVGLDYYRVTPVSTKTGIDQYIDDMGWTFPGLILEYTINPLVGFGGGVDYLTYDRNVANGSTLDFTLFSSVNLSNLLFPKRSGFWKKVSVYGNWGVGLGFFSNEVLATGKKEQLMSPLATSALSIEYKLSKAWALRLEGQFRYYFREDLGGNGSSDGLSQSNSMVYGNDALAATVGVRYKFGTSSKKHVRDVSVDDYYNQTDKKDAAIQQRLKAIEDENKSGKEKIQKLEADLKKLNDEKAAQIAKLQDDLKNIPQAKVADQGNLDSPTVLLDVNFDFNSSELTPKTKAILDQVAVVLKVNKSWSKLSVTGYTDNVGGDNVNKKLSDKRADIVKNYLVAKGIAADAINTSGLGKQNPKTTNNTKEGRYTNRRAELILQK